MTLYPDHLMDHYRHPRRAKFDPKVNYNVSSEYDNPSCGDQIQVRALIKDGIIHDIAFESVGCALSTAATSMIVEEAMGKSVTAVSAWKAQKVLDLVGMPVSPVRMKCALSGLEAVQCALRSSDSRSCV
jgi:nitrogen fixation NifU-like protein